MRLKALFLCVLAGFSFVGTARGAGVRAAERAVTVRQVAAWLPALKNLRASAPGRAFPYLASSLALPPKSRTAALVPLVGALQASPQAARLREALAGGEALSAAQRAGLLSALERARPVMKPRALEELDSLRSFLEERHRELRAAHPEVFLRKMNKAASSESMFFRAFPDLYYRELRSAPLESPELLLAGDLHAGNVELVADEDGRPVPQAGDFDDAGRAPVAAELARMLAGAALLRRSDRAESVAAAKDAYERSLRMSFERWSESAAGEKAVTEAETVDRDWSRDAGEPLKDGKLAARLLKLAGLDPAEWKVFDRLGAGASSIGVRRYLFASPRRGHAWELKELRASALELFTGKPLPQDDAARVAEAYQTLRAVPAEARTLRGEGTRWLLRRRAARETALEGEHPVSAARVLGGLAAQLHRGQVADPASLESAVRAVSAELVLSSLARFSELRRELRRLLDDGVWDAPAR